MVGEASRGDKGTCGAEDGDGDHTEQAVAVAPASQAVDVGSNQGNGSKDES